MVLRSRFSLRRSYLWDTRRIRSLKCILKLRQSNQTIYRSTTSGLRPPHRDRSTRRRVTMRSSSALLFAVLGAVCSWSNASAFFASSTGAARPRGFLPGWGLPRHESALDRVSSAFLFSFISFVQVKYLFADTTAVR